MKLLRNALLIAIAGLGMATTSRAAIGWTLDECKQHLGELEGTAQGTVDAVGRTAYSFHPQKWRVTVLLEKDGTVGGVIYIKDDGISPEVAEMLLNTNSKSSWTKGEKGEFADDKTLTYQLYSAKDGSVASYSNLFGGRLEIRSAKDLEAEKNSLKAEIDNL